MPGSQIVRYKGLEVRVDPYSRWRRWLRYGFYFESRNPSFRVRVKRVGAGNEANLPLSWHFTDGTSTPEDLALPSLALGEDTTLTSKEVLASCPGLVKVTLTIREGTEWETPYTYYVHRTDRLWIAAWAVFVAGLVFAGPIVAALIGNGSG